MAFRAASHLKSTVKNGLNPPLNLKARLLKGDIVPKFMATGMIATSTSLGLYTALHQLHTAPNVHLKKSRRETIPEVVEPEHVVEEADKFIKKSFYRRVSHFMTKFNQDHVVPNPIAGDICTRPLPIDPLKEIGAPEHKP